MITDILLGDDDRIGSSYSVKCQYYKCKDIKLVDNNHIVVGVKYKNIPYYPFREYSLNYPLDYLGLLENMESYIVEKTTPRKGLSQRLLQKEPKAQTLFKGDQMIMDFLKANRKEIWQFKTYAQHVKDVESWKEKAKTMEQVYRIGIDHGYGNIKTAHHIFESGVIERERASEMAGMTVEYEGKFYEIGSTHKEHQMDKVWDDDYYMPSCAVKKPMPLTFRT